MYYEDWHSSYSWFFSLVIRYDIIFLNRNGIFHPIWYFLRVLAFFTRIDISPPDSISLPGLAFFQLAWYISTWRGISPASLLCFYLVWHVSTQFDMSLPGLARLQLAWHVSTWLSRAPHGLPCFHLASHVSTWIAMFPHGLACLHLV